MHGLCQNKNGECWEFFLMLPKLLFLVVETLVDNQLTVRNQIVASWRSVKVLLAEQIAGK